MSKKNPMHISTTSAREFAQRVADAVTRYPRVHVFVRVKGDIEIVAEHSDRELVLSRWPETRLGIYSVHRGSAKQFDVDQVAQDFQCELARRQSIKVMRAAA
jgi:hypothetical protein